MPAQPSRSRRCRCCRATRRRRWRTACSSKSMPSIRRRCGSWRKAERGSREIASCLRIVMSAPPDPLRDLLLDALSPLGPIAARRFFSGTGFTYDGTFFAMIIRGTVYMRVDDGNRPGYEAAGGRPFSYATRKGRITVGAFYTLPEALLDDEEELREWARASIAAALAAKKPKARKMAAGKKTAAAAKKLKRVRSAGSGRSGRGLRAPSRGSNRRNSRSP